MAGPGEGGRGPYIIGPWAYIKEIHFPSVPEFIAINWFGPDREYHYPVDYVDPNGPGPQPADVRFGDQACWIAGYYQNLDVFQEPTFIGPDPHEGTKLDEPWGWQYAEEKVPTPGAAQQISTTYNGIAPNNKAYGFGTQEYGEVSAIHMRWFTGGSSTPWATASGYTASKDPTLPGTWSALVKPETIEVTALPTINQEFEWDNWTIKADDTGAEYGAFSGGPVLDKNGIPLVDAHSGTTQTLYLMGRKYVGAPRCYNGEKLSSASAFDNAHQMAPCEDETKILGGDDNMEFDFGGSSLTYKSRTYNACGLGSASSTDLVVFYKLQPKTGGSP